MHRLSPLAACAVLLAMPGPGRAAGPVAVVAAENFYGDIAQQIGGPAVAVTSILTNPDQDPHLFEVSPSVARAIAAARIVVYSGIDYDPWMETLLAAARNADRRTIAVAALTGHRMGDNPHVWYDQPTILAYAQALAEALTAADPVHQADYRSRLAVFQDAIRPVQAKIAALKDRLSGTPVTATEPLFGYMFQALGMRVRNLPFQMAVMNNTEPGASDVAAFERDLKTRQVRLLVYNRQASDPAAERMRKLAEASGIPVVGATETEPGDTTYQAWMLDELDAVDQALRR